MSASPMPPNARKAEALVKSAKVLIVDDDYYTRKVVRTLLLLVGVTDIHDAGEGRAGWKRSATWRRTSSSSTGRCPA